GTSTNVRKVGIIVFGSTMLALVVRFAFLIVIARVLIVEEFGIWHNINDLTTNFILPATLISFWAQRFFARRHEGSGKTGLILNIIVGLLVSLIFALLVPFLVEIFKLSSYIILYELLILYIMENYIDYALEAILRVSRPVALGYGQLVFHISKFTVVMVMFYIFNIRNIWAVIFSFIFSLFLKEIFYFRLARKHLSGRFNKSYAYEWLKGSTAKGYEIFVLEGVQIPGMIMMTYVGALAVAYYGAVQNITSIITITLMLATAMYPALLQNKGKEVAGAAIRLVLIFLLPFAIFIIALGDVLLEILNPSYVVAYPIIVPSTIAFAMSTLSDAMKEIILGIEKFDEKAKIPIKTLFHSYIFVAFSARWGFVIVAMSLAFIIYPHISNPLLAAEIHGMISLLGELATFLIVSYVVFVRLRISIGRRHVMWYIFANLQLSLLIYLTIGYFKSSLLLLALYSIAALLEYTLVLSLDTEFRVLIRKMFQMLLYHRKSTLSK
ncbi:MAG: hypothetical protein QXL15_02410, partial [Candidatus Korarchaeota archaeon]